MQNLGMLSKCCFPEISRIMNAGSPLPKPPPKKAVSQLANPKK